ncbi:MAG: putative protease [Myxococcaceae bacterium]|jgi:hypothetical protein|nr:putative protease [Myxococcaceae bacterium]
MSDHDSGDGKRSRLEGVIPEMLKRAVEKGVEKATSTPGDIKDFLGDLKLPKEIAHYLFSQVDETKNGLFRVVAKEMRDFLEQTNIAGDIQKVLTTVQFEINTTIRFTPNDGKDGKDKGDKGDAKDRDAKEKDKDRAEGRGQRSSTPPPSHGGGASDEDKERDREREGRDADDEPEDRKDGDKSTPLPKPEVKTEMFVKRDDSRREAVRRSRRGQE